MALSEHEEALLQQMEDALYAEDPRFASRIEKTKKQSSSRGRVIIGSLGGVAGLGLVVGSAISSLIWLGAVGFAAMVAGIVYAITPGKAQLGTVADDGTVKARQKPTSVGKSASARQAGFMTRMEERWEKRRRDQQ